MAEALHNPAVLDRYRKVLQGLIWQLTTAIDDALPDGALDVLFLGTLGPPQ